MATVTISLPEQMKQYVESQVESGSYGNVSEYFRALVRDEAKKSADRRLEELLLQGLDSGEPIVVDEEYFAQRRERLLLKIEGAKAAKTTLPK